MKKILLLLITVFLLSTELDARPQYSILASFGTKCSSCHTNAGYGGQRSFSGFLAKNSVGLLSYEDVGLGQLYDLVGYSNEPVSGKLSFGMDVRIQNARWAQTSKLEEYPDPNADPPEGELPPVVKPTLERQTMAMQLMPYLQYKATDWLNIDAMYNASYHTNEDMTYAGQQPYSVSATISPGGHIPDVRIGYFAPTISIDYDDHTLLVRQAIGAGRANPLIPVDMSELGVQLEYNEIPWLRASLGVFDSKSMSEVMIDDLPAVNEKTLSTVYNLSFHPDWDFSLLGFDLNYFWGVSHYANTQLKTDDGIYFGNNYYTISSAYFNVGLAEKLALMTEYIYSDKQSLRNVNNYLVELTYQIIEPVNVFARYEAAETEFEESGRTFESNQYVFGAHIFPLPFIDILPEYRIYDRGDVGGTSAQWAFQLHIFY